jgi:hypothetical protein
LNTQDLMDPEAASQSPIAYGFSAYPGANGFDFGLSQPKTGLGYGLLGDSRSLASGQSCADCTPSDPCLNCSSTDVASFDDAVLHGDPRAPAGSQGQIVKTQAPAMPFPGWLPPPIPGFPQQPSHPIVIGRPTDWWNWTPGEVADWARGISESRRPSPAVEKKCDEQLDAEYRRCEAIARKATAEAGPKRGSRELISCKDNAGTRHGECRVNNGVSKSPIYPDWYADPPYPDDFENPYPG